MDKDNSWNVSSVDDLPDLAPADATYLVPEVLNTMAKVGISWFHNPGHFFCQLEENKVKIFFNYPVIIIYSSVFVSYLVT